MKISRRSYTAKFKELAVKRVNAGESLAVTARKLGQSEQTLRNWVKAAKTCKLNGAGSKFVTPKEMNCHAYAPTMPSSSERPKS
ncbi:Transposase [Collimonas sp. OK607]|nr:Transposase [Collimonas sp. OK607]